jgi:CheY-like chemotaxis protein
MASEPIVIVLAEDDPIIHAMFTELLNDEGYAVAGAFTGSDAARLIQRLQPDLVITDIEMETRDAGLALLRQIRTDPTTARIAVIVCSANHVLEHQQAEQIRESATFLRKPFELARLLEAIRTLLASNA